MQSSVEKNKVTPFLQNERQKTDDSLDAERGKTNDSLVKTKTNSERRTDQVVQDEHCNPNQAGSLSRIEFAIDHERDSARETVSRLLERERDLTDKNLSHERMRTDTEVGDAITQLSDEVAEHCKTKVSLTSRDEFLAIVSHDLRNPMGAVSSCANMLLDDSAFKSMEKDELKNWLEFIKRNVDSSLRLISDLLDVERFSQEKLELNLAKHDLSQLVQDSVDSVIYAAEAKKICLKFNADEVLGDIVCDRGRLMQVLSNLIGNALKFTPVSGAVTVHVSRLGNGAQISVQDTGPGIAEASVKNIFERFAQIGNKDRNGLGLGLYISRMLVEAHRGKLWVKSKVGEGSTFAFTIP
jgi:signal transduction histidine kinase